MITGAVVARLAVVAAGEVDRIYVHAPDRLARRYLAASGLGMEILATIGGSAQGLIERLPGFVRKRLDRITLVALNRAFDAATQSRRYVRDRGDWFNRLASTVSGAAGGFASGSSADRLIDLIYAPKAQYRPNGRFVMNRRTVSAIRKFKDADGNYLWQPPLAADRAATLLGFPVVEAEAIGAWGLRAGTSSVSSVDWPAAR